MLRLHVVSQAALARELGVDRAAVHRWCTGEKRPAPTHAARLHVLLGVDPSAWERLPGETERAALERLERDRHDARTAELARALADHLGTSAAAVLGALTIAGLVPARKDRSA